MRNHFLIAFLAMLLFCSGNLSAQNTPPKSWKKERKMHKKEHKIANKMFHGHTRSARRKYDKQNKKGYQAEQEMANEKRGMK